MLSAIDSTGSMTMRLIADLPECRRHHARGMLSVRDRVSLILDDNSPFLELMPSAGYEIKHSSPSASSLAGIGLVHGQMVVIGGNIPTLDSGAANEMTVKKQLRLSDIALQNGLPSISLNQSAGANLPQQFKVFHDGGRQFRDIARRSAEGAPTCTVVFGSSTAGGAYQPGMSSYSIFVREQAQVFLGGPPLVYMATGEVTTAEALGGAEMHTSVSGVGDAFAADEFEACRLARSWVLTLPKQHRRESQVAARPPLYDPADILSVVPVSIRQPMDMREVVARLVDDGRFQGFKPTYGDGMLCAWAHIHGRLAGIIGNQRPVIMIPEAQKATHFIRLANEAGTPLVFLHNVTGFMVGARAETGGIIKAGSLMIDAVSRSTVPHVSVICGASYGAGNYAMCGRAYAPRFLFSWPHSKCSVMGPEQLAGVMDMIAREAAAKSGRPVDEARLGKTTEGLRGQVERESEAYTTSAWCLDDGVIDPRDTGDVLGMCLEICDNRPGEGNPGMRGVSRI
ncbi:carboxyl transferase [Plectosphaerella cucumerina]|uniref:methylcrotonoyl-CoA carboxylase n=1 Tax=Plectosphaerella cucumerina TaxID=40658 RepID=A0A8K0TMY2_9PEZI|nr:carboxyl transferase [Plectosphaerella cucumerina]